MLSRWQGGFATVVVALGTVALIVLDQTDRGFRGWWAAHALTTDTVAGLLIVLITVLMVDQLLGRRQVLDRAQAMAAQAAIMVSQARRSVAAVSDALEAVSSDADSGSGGREAAADEVRTYMMMLLVGAPVLIEARVSRAFLEEAQRLGAELAQALTALSGKSPFRPWAAAPASLVLSREESSGRLRAAADRLRAAASPLLEVLTPAVRAAVSDVSEAPEGG